MRRRWPSRHQRRSDNRGTDGDARWNQDVDGPTAPTNVIIGFVAGDTLDFYGAAIGARPTVKLPPGNVLQIVENHQTYDFQFDPNDNFTGQNFHVTDDGYGGTLIFINPAVAPVTSPRSRRNVGRGVRA